MSPGHLSSVDPQAFLAALTESADDAIVSKRLDGIITTWNKAAERLFGHRRDEIVGRSITTIVPPHLINEEKAIIERLRRGERIEHLDTVRVHKDGYMVEVSLTISPIKDERGVIIGASKIARDISERRRIETERTRLLGELRRAVEVRDTFLSVASHELRTPLNTLKLLIQTVQVARSLGKNAEFDIDAIDRQSERLIALVDRLLDVSRLSGGKLELEPEAVDVAALTRDVASRFRGEAAQSGSTIEVQANVHLTAQWDRIRIEQVLTNLLSNAIKYGEGKPIVVTAEGRAGCAELSVRDHGIGISPVDQKKLFTRFERLVSPRHFGGLGLGLWITAQIIEAHGGSIAVESDVGQGARFTATLPLVGGRA